MYNLWQHKTQGDSNRIGVYERRSAQQLLSATRFFKDDVHVRCVLLESPGDVFAEDILYHKTCLSSYILKFKRELELIMMDNDVLQTLDLGQEEHYVSTVRDHLNDRLKEENLSMQFTSLFILVFPLYIGNFANF